MNPTERTEAFPRPLWALTTLTAMLAALVSGAGLFWDSPGMPVPFQTAHGETVFLYGRGLYRADWAFRVPIQQGTDAVMLFIVVPAMLFSLFWARRHLRGRLLLSGLLVSTLYNAASTAFGVAFNPLFPAYVAYLSVSLFTLVLNLSTLRVASLPEIAPRRGVAVFLFLSGLSTAIWALEILPALTGNRAPATLGPYTTEVTAILDWGLVAPTCFLASISVLRRKPLGAWLAPAMLTLMVVVGLIVLGQRVAQALAGEAVTMAQTAGYVAPFVLLSGLGAWLLARVLRAVREVDSARE